MAMNRKIVLILLLFFTFSLGFSSQIQASVGSNNYVIFRAKIAPLYIYNQSSPIQVLAIAFENNKPIYSTVNIYINIKGYDVNYSYNNIIPIASGQTKTIYLPSMQRGHYSITIYAEYHGIKSHIAYEDFAVVPAPLPYSLTFSNDGSEITFTSKVLNATGYPDPDKPFRLEIFVWDGVSENEVSTYTNVTNLTIRVPQSWRTGILIVNVYDIYGWVNGMSINLANFQFQGYPVQYDYEQAHRYPRAGYSWQYYFMVVIGGLIFLYIGYRVFENDRREE